MDPIDLAALRAEAERTNPKYPCEIAREDVLALIDVVEAAREALPWFDFAELARIEEALARFK